MPLLCTYISLLLTVCTYGTPVDNYLGEFQLSKYYTPIEGQSRYYLNKTFIQDFTMNCSGDCLITANGHKLHDGEWGKVVACPPSIKLGTRLRIEDIGEVTCHDRGGAIKNKRLDIWMGVGEEGLDRVYRKARQYGGVKKVYLLQ